MWASFLVGKPETAAAMEGALCRQIILPVGTQIRQAVVPPRGTHTYNVSSAQNQVYDGLKYVLYSTALSLLFVLWTTLTLSAVACLLWAPKIIATPRTGEFQGPAD